MVGKEVQQDADYLLGMGVLEESEHDSVDGLDEVVGFVVDVSGLESLEYLCFVLVLVN